MKKVFAIIMSLSLIIAPVNVARAEGSAANQILSLGTAAVGTSILTACAMGSSTPSLVTFMAGSFAYVGSEILGAEAKKAFLDVRTEEIKHFEEIKERGGNLQLEVLEAKLRDEEDQLKFVEKRKKWTQAIGAIYLVATALAAMEAACVSSVVGTAACSNWIYAACNSSASFSSMWVKNALMAAYGFGAGKASNNAYMGMGVALGTAITSLGASLQVVYATSFARIITFGASSLLVLKVANDLTEIQRKLEGNIDKLNALISSFKRSTEVEGGVGDDQERDDVEKSKKMKPVKALPKVQKLAKMCWSKGGSDGPQFTSASCSSPIKIPKPNLNANFNLPTLASMANTASDFSDAVARGDFAAADVAAGTLASGAGRMKEIRDNILKQVNDGRKTKGEKAIDFDGDIQKRVAEMGAQLNKDLAAKGHAALALGNATLGELVKDENKSVSIGAIDSNKEVVNSAPALNFKLDEGVPVEEASEASMTEGTVAERLENFETNIEDINKKSDVSIFKQLSVRYLMNYSKFFEKRKLEETSDTPAPVAP